MNRRLAFTAALAATLLSVPPLRAQDSTQQPTMTVAESVLTQGGTATITYDNPALAGKAVVIQVDNGMRRNPVTMTIELQLDANGHGVAVWTVPTWDVAKFNAPNVPEVGRMVVAG